MHRTRHLKSVAFLILSCLGTLAGQQQLSFEHLDLEEGLSHSLITDMIQDRKGFVWVGTQDGLNRYDGYQFQTFRPVPQQKNSPYGKWVSDLFEDRKGQIWVRYRSGGLDRYDPIHQQFYHYLHDPSDPRSISDDLPTEFRFVTAMRQTMLEDRNGNIWIGTADGLNRYNRSQDNFTRYYHQPDDPHSLPGNIITTLIEDKAGFLWIGTTRGIARFDPATGRCLRFQHDPENPLESLSDNYIRTVLKDSRGDIWAGTRFGGVSRISCDSSAGQYRIEQYLYDPSTPAHARTDGVYGMLETRRGEIWVGAETGVFFMEPGAESFTAFSTDQPISKAQFLLEDSKGFLWIGGSQIEFGLLRVSPDDRNRVETYNHSEALSHSLSNNAISGLMEDRTGVLWIGTVKGGINLVDNNRKQFRHYYHDPSNPNSLNDNDVYAIYEDGEGTLWVGTKSGLNRINRKTGKVKIYEKHADNENSPSGQLVGVIEPAPGGFLWLGYFDYKISKFYPNTEQFIHFHHHELDPESYLAWSVRDILVDREKRTWFGASTYGLTQLKPNGRSFRYFPNESPIPLPSNKYSINCLHQDRDGYLWVGSFDSGLSRFDPQQQTFKNYKHHPADPNSLSSNEIKCILEENGSFWIGTGAGLNHFNPKTEVFRAYTNHDGLPNNTVLGILKDERGRLWLSTNGGLSCFAPATGTFHNYFVEDGLQSNEFNEGAYFKSPEGEFFFGGVNGVTAFFPDSIQPNPFLPEVAITELRIFNQPVYPGDTVGEQVILSQAMEYTRELVLSYRESVFSFGFTALHFAAASKNRFAYKMEGFDSDWTYTGADQRYATYTNLDPGEYTFRVKATNNDGHWNETGDFIRIRILPPWWDTPLFRRSLFLFLFLATIGIIRLRILRLKAQKVHLEHLVQERTSALSQANTELDESRRAVLAQKNQIEAQKKHLEEQNRNIRLLSEIGQNITSTIKIEEIMTKIYESLNALMDAPNFSIGQINPSREVIDFFAFEAPGKPLSNLEIPLNDQRHLSVWTIHNGEPIFMNEVEQEVGAYFEDVPERYDAGNSYQSAIYLPLRAASEKVIGILIVKSPKAKAYTPFHLQVLKNLAAYIAIAIDNAQAYREIEEQSEQLRDMDELKTRFYTNISHEFRTPLTLILGSVADLQKGASLSPIQRRSLQMLERNARRLLRLVTQIMDLSKLEGGVLQLEVSRGNIVRHIRLIADSFNHLAQHKEVNFSFYARQKEIEGFIDQDKLEKIIYNLLFNAFKFTPKGGQINLFLRVLHPDSLRRQLEIEVKDTGSGIPEDELKHIFQRFYQVRKGAGYRSDGAGIGLSLVHHLIALHHGTIEVQSSTEKPERGTCFRLRIPIDQTAYEPEEISHHPDYDKSLNTQSFTAGESPSISSPAPEPPSLSFRDLPTVLVVEDNDDMRTYIRESLKDHFRVLEAEHGKTGIDIAHQKKPDVILTDIMMPCCDGFDLCQQLKSDVATSHIPIIILTAKTSLEAELEGLRAGADDYITKPFRTEAIRYKLQNIIHTRRKLAEQYKNDIWMKEEKLTRSPSDQAMLQQAIDIINQNLNDPGFDVSSFTREMAMGRTVLYEKIKNITGLSINDLIKTHRLKVAARMMLEENLSIGEISYRVGFNDPKYFSKCFKKQFGQSPKQYIASFAAE